MNWSNLLMALGVTLNAGGAAVTGWMSTAMHVVGGIALYLAKSPMAHGASDDTPPTGA